MQFWQDISLDCIIVSQTFSLSSFMFPFLVIIFVSHQKMETKRPPKTHRFQLVEGEVEGHPTADGTTRLVTGQRKMSVRFLLKGEFGWLFWDILSFGFCWLLAFFSIFFCVCLLMFFDCFLLVFFCVWWCLVRFWCLPWRGFRRRSQKRRQVKGKNRLHRKGGRYCLKQLRSHSFPCRFQLVWFH